MKKLPVFFHIPRSGGTYVYGMILLLVRLYGERNWLPIRPDLWIDNLKIMHVSDEEQQEICYIIVNDFDCRHNEGLFRKIDRFTSSCSLQDFTDYYNKYNVEVFSVVITPHGVPIHGSLCSYFEDLTGHSLVRFMALRDPFQRASSVFRYLNAAVSVHEPTHRLVRSKTFSEYINSSEQEDNRVVRMLCNILDNQQVSDEDYKQAEDMISSFMISKTENVDSLLNEVFSECYDELTTVSCIENHRLGKRISGVNKNQSKSIAIDDLSDHTVAKFIEANKYDQKLYEKYTKDLRHS